MERELIVKRIESRVVATEKRIGVIAPGGGKINEGEFPLVSPPSVSFLIIVLGLGNTRIPDVVAPPLIENAAQALTAAGADMILLGGLPVGFFQPRGYESELTTRITNACGLPAATMAGATVEALSRLNIKRPVVVSHYNDRLSAGLRSLLSAYGIEAATLQSIDQERSASLADQEATDLYCGLARKAYVEAGESDGFLISGGGTFSTVEIVNRLERDMGVPVVSSSLAAIWKSLRMLGYHEPIGGFGRLLGLMEA
jgi:maleate cis-trans isomerase